MSDGFEGLSDKTPSIVTVAAYDRLVRGRRMSSVVRRDGARHRTAAEGIAELERRSFVTAGETTIEGAERFVETPVEAVGREVGR